MQVVYGDLIVAHGLLWELLNATVPLPAKMSAQIAGNIRHIEAHLKDFEVARNSLVKALESSDNADDVKARIDLEYAELVATKVDVEIHPLKMGDIEELEKVRQVFIPGKLFYFDWLVSVE